MEALIRRSAAEALAGKCNVGESVSGWSKFVAHFCMFFMKSKVEEGKKNKPCARGCLLASTSVPLKPCWCQIYLKKPTAEQVISLISSRPLTEAMLMSQFKALNARLCCSTTCTLHSFVTFWVFSPLKSVITSAFLHSSRSLPPSPYEMLPSWLSL